MRLFLAFFLLIGSPFSLLSTLFFGSSLVFASELSLHAALSHEKSQGVMIDPFFINNQQSPRLEPRIVAVAESNKFYFFLDEQGDLWAFRYPFVLKGAFRFLRNVKKVTPYMALTKDGKVYIWDLSDKSKWGVDGETIDAVYTKPKLIEGLNHVTDIASTYKYFLAVVKGEHVFEVKRRIEKRGLKWEFLGFTQPKLLFTAPKESKIRSMASSGLTTILLLDNGQVLGWGRNSYSQLRPPTSMEDQMTSISPDHPVILSVPEPASKIYATPTHSVVLTEKGHVYYWGNCMLVQGVFSQGIAAAKLDIDDVQDVSLSDSNINNVPNIFLKKDGSLWIAYAPPPHISTNTPKKQCQGLLPRNIQGQRPYKLDMISQKIRYIPPTVRHLTSERDQVFLAIDVHHRFWSLHWKVVNPFNSLQSYYARPLDFSLQP